MLTREEVNERLETWALDRSQRDALQTALNAMDERDALLAENRLLRDSLALVDDIDGWHLASNVRIALESAFLPRTAAEVERVRRLEAVAKAFAEEWNDSPKCTCHEAYKNRNRDDPDCLYHKSPLLWDALAALEGRDCE